MVRPSEETQARVEASRRPITLPRFDIPDIIDTEREQKEAAKRFAEYRVVKEGLARWQTIAEANSFEAWKAIGRALLIGKRHVMKTTGANAAWGSRYSKAFGSWMIEHHFDSMPAGTRSNAITLAEHEQEIVAWRNGLPERQKRRLINPQSVTKRWRAATRDLANLQPVVNQKPAKTARNPQPGADLARDAWRRFVSCMEALPRDQAAPLWREAQARAAEFLCRAA